MGAGARAFAVDGPDGRPLRLFLRRSRRARRMALRTAHGAEGVELVLPYGVPEADGLAFARAKAGWIAERLEGAPPAVPFAPGAIIPVAGIPHRIVLSHRVLRGIEAAEGELRVFGRAERVAPRVEAWLRGEARARLSALAGEKCARLGLAPPQVGVREVRSRWGSCAASGRLSFSWRLAMAPAFVQDYVVAHEVAHLRHMNHGPRFWALAASLTIHLDEGRAWLRAHGAALHRYG